MESIIILVLLFGCVISIAVFSIKSTSGKPSNTRNNATNYRRADVSNYNVKLDRESKEAIFKELGDVRPQYREGREFKIVGLNKVPPFETIGDFIGYVKPDVNNEYDDFAISVHALDSDELLGYLPRANINKALFNALVEQDKALCGGGYISKFTDDNGKEQLYGRIYLDIAKQ